jgi:hypothetical protein
MPTVKSDVDVMETDFDSADYYGTADMASSLAKLALPVPADYKLGNTVSCGNFSLNTVEIADFLAGFMAGFTGHDDKTYMETCF